MTFLYPDPIVNETSFSSLFEVFNTATDGFFGLGLILSIYIILFIAMKNFEFNEAFAASSFIVVILSAIMLAAGLITQTVMIIMSILLLVSLIFLFFKD